MDPNILQGSQRAPSINQKWNHVFSNCLGLRSIGNKREDCSRNLIKSGGVRVVDTEQILTRIFCIKSIWRKVFCRAGGKLQKEKGKFREKERWGWVGGRPLLCSEGGFINQLIESLINRSMFRWLSGQFGWAPVDDDGHGESEDENPDESAEPSDQLGREFW